MRIDDVLRRDGRFRRDVTVSAGGNIRLQPSQEGRHLHRAGHLADPNVHAGFQFIEVALHAKARLFHEVSGEKAVDGRHHPGMVFDVAVGEPQLSERGLVFMLH